MIVALLAVSGCASRESIAKADADDCTSYGLKFGTSEYARCRMQKDQQRQELAARIYLDAQRSTAAEQSAHNTAAISAFGNR